MAGRIFSVKNGNGKEKALPAEENEMLRQAEVLARGEAERDPVLSAAALRRHLHELQSRQTALEQQNRELSLTRNEIVAGLENYTELYDFAPVGYCTLDRAGVIRKMNLTGASLLGEHRSRLLHRSLDQFVSDENRPIFNEMLAKVFDGQQKKALCEVVIHPQGLRPPLPVKIVAMAAATGDECLAVVIDISERRRLEAEALAANGLMELNRMRERAAELLTLNRQLTDEIEERNKLEQTLFDSQTRLRNLSAQLQSSGKRNARRSPGKFTMNWDSCSPPSSLGSRCSPANTRITIPWSAKQPTSAS